MEDDDLSCYGIDGLKSFFYVVSQHCLRSVESLDLSHVGVGGASRIESTFPSSVGM